METGSVPKLEAAPGLPISNQSGSLSPCHANKFAFFLEPLQLWDAREHARRRKFFNDVNAVIALVSGMCAPCQARGEELGFYAEQCLCVPFTQKKQRKPESFPQGIPSAQI